MKRFLIASTRENAGKSSLIIGIAGALNKPCGYIKPLGDRLVYLDKKNFDYDAALIGKILGITSGPENLSLGFSYDKIKSHCGGMAVMQDKVDAMIKNAGEKEILFIETGKDCSSGSSINLDPVTLSGFMEDSRLIFVTGGNYETIMDDIRFLHDYIHKDRRKVDGIIINKVHDTESFTKNCMGAIEDMGIRILGTVPYRDELTRLTMRYISGKLSAKVIAGHGGIDNVVENILVGAMTPGELLNHILFNRLHKLLITSGDRSDIILAAFESDTSGIVLTNQILPPAQIISMADDKKIPMLLAKGDTFHVAKQIDDMEPLLTYENSGNIKLLVQLAEENIDLSGFTE